MTALALEQPGQWVLVCRVEQVPVDRGVAALVDGRQVALVRTRDGSLHALGNRDPFSGAMVLARGIVGSRGDAPVLVSPMFKQAFDLRTGTCVEDPDVGVPVHEVRERGGMVEVRLALTESA